MECPNCGAEGTKPRIISSETKINEHGRLQGTVIVDREYFVHYDRERGTYTCSKCGHEFSVREAFLQKRDYSGLSQRQGKEE